jgi:hypothetical protein
MVKPAFQETAEKKAQKSVDDCAKRLYLSPRDQYRDTLIIQHYYT